MGIAKFLARRLVFGVFTLLVVSVLVFLLTHSLGDPAEAILGRDARQPAALASKRAELGLDRPLRTQYLDWLAGVVRGDLGESYSTGRPIRDDMSGRVTNSLVLMACGALLAVPVSLLVGVRAALRRDKAFDTGANLTSLALAAIPEFVLATALVVLFSIGVFEVLPAVSSVRGETRPWNDLDGMILPSVTLALMAMPYIVRSTRASMVEELESEHIGMARLNGLDAHTIVWGHAVPNAMGPTFQVIALSLAYMAGGVVVIEQVFNYPGIGSALVDAVATHDVPVVQFVALVVATLYVTFNTLADVGTVLVTPRLRTALT